jgi:hypothetical protein
MGGVYTIYDRELINIFRVIFGKDYMGELGLDLIIIL